ncbi:unnamed protein product [Rotaria sp. Silwood2]|nr:unnamed protein product [Rotaria sp. Silwood2]
MFIAVQITMAAILLVDPVLLYTKVTTDYDLYGIKVAMNDRIMVSADNLYLVWYILPISANSSFICFTYYNETTCDFVYSIVVPMVDSTLFVYNCIDYQGNNLIGFFASNTTCDFLLVNEQIISNYSTQDNFVITIDGNGTGVYGFADDFIFFYELQAPFKLTVWPNIFNISPRAIDIGSSMQYGVLVGYCQSTPSTAIECGSILALNNSLSIPDRVNDISIRSNLNFNWSDPRINFLVAQSRAYSADTTMSVSIAWRTRQILIGIQSLNIVLLYAFDNVSQPISTRQNEIGFSGFGKSVAWLDNQGQKAVILANRYVYLTKQWISSSVHIYDVASDGFTDETQPVLIFPNSEQTMFEVMNVVLIQLTCSKSGTLAIFDILGNTAALISAPAGMYPYTGVPYFTSSFVPCISGTHRNYSGLELCTPCPNGTFSNNCEQCARNDSFCPYGSVQDLSYSTFESIEQNQEYPESPETTVFDDLLMQNMFSLNAQSPHCIRVSPMTWVLVVFMLGIIVAITAVVAEAYCPRTHKIQSRLKQLFQKVDLVGEGEVSKF